MSDPAFLGHSRWLLGCRRRRRSVVYSPAQLFVGGEQGCWFEAGPTTCFQDAAGSIVAGLGDPVGHVRDLSGQGNHATQATVSSRPTLRQTAGGLWYLEFDGVDDFLVTPTAGFGTAGKDSVTFSGAWRHVAGTPQANLLALGDGSSNGTFRLQQPSGSGAIRGALFLTGTSTGIAAFPSNAFDGTVLGLWTFSGDISEGTGTARKNGVFAASSSPGFGSGNFIDAPLQIADSSFAGEMYSLVVVSKPVLGDDLGLLESYGAALAGVTLP